MDFPGNPVRIWLMAEILGGGRAGELGCDSSAPTKRAERPQSFQPFEIAHTIYQIPGDTEIVIGALYCMLHPRWKKMSEENIPRTLSKFRREYRSFFPRARIRENVIPNLSGAVWQADPVFPQKHRNHQSAHRQMMSDSRAIAEHSVTAFRYKSEH